MNIISVTTHSTLWEEIMLCIIALFIFALLVGILSLEYKRSGKLFKTVTWITILAVSGVIIYGVPNNIKRAYKYEVIEAEVTEWDYVMNNEDYKLLEQDGNLVKLKRIIEK